jgi:hypothetical protein
MDATKLIGRKLMVRLDPVKRRHQCGAYTVRIVSAKLRPRKGLELAACFFNPHSGRWNGKRVKLLRNEWESDRLLCGLISGKGIVPVAEWLERRAS